jgi:type IV fimbrial biogenesis protein FimT
MTAFPAHRGFTLLELMAAIGIAAIVLGFAVPAITGFVSGAQLRGAARDFVVDFQLARSEAALRARRVTVCTSADMMLCTNRSWDDGRLVFVDGGAEGTLDAGDQILSQTAPLGSPVTTTASGIAAAYFISFAPNGMLAGTGTIELCAPGKERRVVNILRSGSATLDRAVPC